MVVERAPLALGADLDHGEHAAVADLDRLGHGDRPRRRAEVRQALHVGVGAADGVSSAVGIGHIGDEIVVERGSTIQELAPKLNRTTADLVRLLFDAGEMVTGTQSLADEMVDLIAEALGAEVLLVEPGQEAELELQALLGDDDDEDDDV